MSGDLIVSIGAGIGALIVLVFIFPLFKKLERKLKKWEPFKKNKS